jgi:pyrophosphatase PpaX
MRFETVLFDLDGTLIDSGAMILASFRHATRAVLEREVPDTELLALVGSTHLREQMQQIDADRADELVRAYRVHNEPLHAELRACTGMLDVVERLHAERRRLGIVTAKRHATVRLAFDVCPLERFFSTVVAAEDTERHKPYPDPVLAALERLGARAEDAAYVGDAPFDVESAKAAGVFAIAVGWGGIHPHERVLAAGPDAFVHNAAELLGVL